MQRQRQGHLVVAIADVGCRDEQLEWIFLSIVVFELGMLLDLLHALLTVTDICISARKGDEQTS